MSSYRFRAPGVAFAGALHKTHLSIRYRPGAYLFGSRSSFANSSASERSNVL